MSRKVPAPSSMEIHLLGPFRVLVGGAPVGERRWPRRKPQLLLKLLALEPHHRLHREQLLELLWPDLDAGAAANNLHKAIHLVRHALEPRLKSGADSHFLLTQGQQVVLCAPGGLWVDAEEFERRAAEALGSADTKGCEAALALYGGDLLAEDLYEDWAAARRERLRALRQELLARLAGLYEARGQYGLSVERLKQLVADDPANEEAHRRLMSLYARTGDRRQALRQYEQCRDTLRRELEAEPEPATVALRERIISGRLPPLPAGAGRRAPDDFAARDSLAILPLANDGADPEAEYLSDGITESIISNLSQLARLRVMARSTVFRYKGREVDPQEVGRELGARAVLTGRVLRLGERLVIRAELVDASDGAQLWGGQYDRDFSDVLAVQEEIARRISESLQLKLTGEEQRLLARRHTEDTAAYQTYLKGLYYWNKRTEGGLVKAIEHFARAVEEDSGYALAHVGLANSYAVMSWYSALSPKDSFPKAKAAATKALELDDTLAEAHAALAFIRYGYDWDWAGAGREFERALELKPAYATARHWHAIFLSGMGRHPEAVAEIERALELEPLSLVINRDVGWVLYWARRYEEAVESYRKTLELAPDFYIAHYFFGEAYEQMGRRREAIAEFRETKSHAKEGTRVWTLLGHARAHALTGRRDDALKCVAELVKLSETHYVSPYLLAIVHTSLGDDAGTLRWLERAFEERDPYLTYLRVEPALDGLRAAPRFRDLLRRAGLTA